MGQYWKPVSIDKMEYLYSHDFDTGLKLMEHSYIGNNFVEAVERLLSLNGAWYRTRFCWAGDYMDEGLFVPPDSLTYVCDGEEYNHTLYSYVNEKGKNVVEGAENINRSDYDKAKSKAKELTDKFLSGLPKAGKFLVNHTKKLCLDLSKERGTGEKWNNGKSIVIHPLPLLTCSGNGRGGGDFRAEENELVGSWAGDVISMEYEPIYEMMDPCNFKEED